MRAICKTSVIFSGLVACMMCMMVSAGTAGAELTAWDFILAGDVELGGRIFIDQPSGRERGKFEEYRDIPESAFLDNLHLQAVDKDDSYFLELLAKDAVEDDQYYYLKSSKIGLYTFQFEWDQVPHLYATESHLGDELSTRSDFARFSLDVTPTPELDIFADYQFIDKHGERPRGAHPDPFDPPDDALEFNEFREPVRYNQHDATIGTSFARRAYQLQLSYSLSLLENDVSSVVNPEAGASVRDRLALPPDNMAHSINLQGGANLPFRTRLNGVFSYGLRLQDEDLLPVIGTGQATPASEFEGEVNTYLAYISSLSHPIDPLTIKAMYRFYKYDDISDEPGFPLPMDDGSTFTVLALRFPYTKHNAGFDAKWQFEWPVALILGYDFELYERDNDLHSDTTEHTPKLGLNATPFDWLFLGVTYSHSIRDAEGETIRRTSGHVPPPIPPHSEGTRNCAECHRPNGIGPYPLLTNSNQADRERDKVDAIAEFTVLKNLSFSITGSLAQNDYDSFTDFGLLEDNEWSIGGGLTWKPWSRLALNANYLHEELASRIRADVFDPFENEVDIDPRSKLATDSIIDTVGAGMTLTLMPEKLDLEARWAMSLARTDFNTNELPDLDETYNQYSTYLRYHFTKHWTAKIGYVFEDFDVSDEYGHDVQLSSGEEFISDFYEDYTAHLIVLGLAYHF